MSILITGGLGYIGSHICVRLMSKGYTCVIVDNLLNSKLDVLNKIEFICGSRPHFYKQDVGKNLDDIFLDHSIYCVIHCAGLKSVNESIGNPLEYYYGNVSSTINLLKYMEKYDVRRLIFSSSCVVYGDQPSPFNETMDTGINLTNPYATSKYMIEKILDDLKDWNVVSLRYFNPIGSHYSGLLTENPNGPPNNIMPCIIRVADGEQPFLKIFGNSYDTPDGTAMRDYIHVMDLADAHVKAVKNIGKMTKNVKINIGTGRPISVLELINCFNQVHNMVIPCQFVDKREGDLAKVYCASDKAHKLLKWHPKYTLSDMCYNSWPPRNMQMT
jgi:UDP-glucose 4-epimerase